MVETGSALVPKKVFLTSGVGRDEDELVSFEFALRDAGIEKFNLVPVSSILPPGCEVVDREKGLEFLKPGQIVFCVMARMTSNEEGKRIFASIGMAVPPGDTIGYIAEHSGYCTANYNDYAGKIAARMLETAFNVKPKRVLVECAEGEVRGCTTAVAAAVFIL